MNEELKRLVRCTCDSAPSKFIPVKDFGITFRKQTQQKFDFDAHGYPTAESFLRDVPDVCRFEKRTINGATLDVVIAVTPEGVYRPTFMEPAGSAPGPSKTKNGSPNKNRRFTYDLFFDATKNPTVTDLDAVFPSAVKSHADKNLVFIRFPRREDADRAMASVLSVRELSYTTDTVARMTEEDRKDAAADIMCLSCGLSGHKKDRCPRATSATAALPLQCSNCCEEGHSEEECQYRAFDTFQATSGCQDFQKNYAKDVKDIRKAALASLTRANAIQNSSREEVPLHQPPVCFNCGEKGHKKGQCPQLEDGGMQCFRCRERGHHFRDCPSKAAEPVPFCYNCAREGHSRNDCDVVIAAGGDKIGMVKIYLGHMDQSLDDEEVIGIICDAVGEDCVRRRPVIKCNGRNRFAFVELTLPLPLTWYLEKVWSLLSDLAGVMNVNSVGPENVQPVEQWERPIKPSPSSLFGVNSLSPEMFDLRLRGSPEKARLNAFSFAVYPSERPSAFRFPASIEHAKVVPFNSIAPPPLPRLSSPPPPYPGLPSLPPRPPPYQENHANGHCLPRRPPGAYPALIPHSGYATSVAVPLESNLQLSTPLDRQLPPQPRVPISVGRDPKIFNRGFLDSVQAATGSKWPLVQVSTLNKEFRGTCSCVVDGARFFIVNVCNEQGEHRPDEWKDFLSLDSTMNHPITASSLKREKATGQGICLFREGAKMKRGYLDDGQIFAIDEGSLLDPTVCPVYEYPEHFPPVSLQALPCKLGDVNAVVDPEAAMELKRLLLYKRLELRMYKSQSFNASQVVLVEVFVDGRSVAEILREKELVELCG